MLLVKLHNRKRKNFLIFAVRKGKFKKTGLDHNPGELCRPAHNLQEIHAFINNWIKWKLTVGAKAMFGG